VLLVATAFRSSMLGEVPPGLAHDEVANWLIAQDILGGHHAVYFTAAYGHEPLYQYVQAATVFLFGDHWLGIRYPSLALGLLGLAVTHVLVRRLFGASIALITAAWLAVSFWPLFYARVGLRAILLPFTAALAGYFMHRALGTAKGRLASRSPAIGDWLLAGLFIGLSVYTYMASRVLPFVVAAFVAYSFLLHVPVRKLWRGVVLMFVVAAIVSAPLLAWLAAHPGAEARIAEVQEPLNRLLAGDPSLVWLNTLANLKFFMSSGDPWPRQNLPGRPVFSDPVSAALFIGGLVIALWRWRDRRYGFLLIWLFGALAPSIATSDAPSSIRGILGLVVVFAFPALALGEVDRWLEARRLRGGRSDLSLSSLACVVGRWSLVVLPIVLTGLLTVRDYFVRWPQNDVVRFDYQSGLTAAAHRLNELPPQASVAVAGLSVATMDGPGLKLAANRAVDDVRLCDTREAMVVPAGPDRWLLVPYVVPFDGDLRERLMDWGAEVEIDSPLTFTSYRLRDDRAVRSELRLLEGSASLPDGTAVQLPASFGGRLAFLGYEQLQSGSDGGRTLALLSYWRVEDGSPTPLKVFVHVVGQSVSPLAQHDGLGSPPKGWQAGDLIVQKHAISLPVDLTAGRYSVQVGVADAGSGVRLRVLTADRLLLYSLTVSE
jgi:4-amino-4-deoxy-L-arabinose transferase-like glycosyltransferase